MSDLHFDTGENEFGAPRQAQPSTDLPSKLVEWGLVADRQQASYVLIGLGVLALIIAFFLIRSGGSEAPPLLP